MVGPLRFRSHAKQARFAVVPAPTTTSLPPKDNEEANEKEADAPNETPSHRARYCRASRHRPPVHFGALFPFASLPFAFRLRSRTVIKVRTFRKEASFALTPKTSSPFTSYRNHRVPRTAPDSSDSGWDCEPDGALFASRRAIATAHSSDGSAESPPFIRCWALLRVPLSSGAGVADSFITEKASLRARPPRGPKNDAFDGIRPPGPVSPGCWPKQGLLDYAAPRLPPRETSPRSRRGMRCPPPICPQPLYEQDQTVPDNNQYFKRFCDISEIVPHPGLQRRGRPGSDTLSTPS